MRRFSVLGAVIGAVVLVGAACSPPTPVDPPPGGTTVTVDVGGATVSVSVPHGPTVSAVSVDLATLPPAPAGVVFAFGALAINLQNVTPGAVARVTIAMPDPIDTVRKLIGGEWDPFTPDGTTGASLSADGRTVTLDLRDGGRGDSDGVANGAIADPVALGKLTGALAISQGPYHGCALIAGGTVKCWGEWFNDHVNIIITNHAADQAGILGATAISAGDEHTCAVVGSGAVRCWGETSLGRLGGGAPSALGIKSNESVPVVGLAGATAISAGGGHTCAIVAAGAVKCWGWNGYGQLGNGDATHSDSNVPVGVVGITGATAISTGAAHTCAVVAGGAVKCWGHNPSGELGDGNNNDTTAPAAVVGVTGATAISAEGSHTCVRVAGGAMKCWGANFFGQLGNGLHANSNLPVNVNGVTGATAISTGGGSSCAVVAGGAVRCWGSNDNGELGDGTYTASTTPVGVLGIAGATAIEGGSSEHTCALVAGGAVKCWGRNVYSQLGNGTAGGSSNVPTDVLGVTGATAVSAGGDESCALVSGGTVKCWGRNQFGQLGIGSHADSNVPATVVGVSGVTAIATGLVHTCAIVALGEVRCWGGNQNGQFGRGHYANSSVPAGSAIGVTGATAIAAGAGHTCAIVALGAVKCWGGGNGQIGNGTSGPSPVPVDVVGVTGATAIAAGWFHTCAIVALGAVKCWGTDLYGELGDGPSSPHVGSYSNLPVDVVGLTGATSISAGKSRTCAIVADGAVTCWGVNDQGQLGTGDAIPFSTVAVNVVGVTGATSISPAATSNHSCVAIAFAQVQCWGSNVNGQLGNGGPTGVGAFSNTPVDVPGVTPALDVSAGESHTCAVLPTGSVRCFGRNLNGQLGNGTFIDTNAPVTTLGSP